MITLMHSGAVLESTCIHSDCADSSSFTVLDSVGVMHQIIGPRSAPVGQQAISKQSDFLTQQRAITKVISQLSPHEENTLGAFLLEDAKQTDMVALFSQLKAAFIR